MQDRYAQKLANPLETMKNKYHPFFKPSSSALKSSPNTKTGQGNHLSSAINVKQPAVSVFLKLHRGKAP